MLVIDKQQDKIEDLIIKTSLEIDSSYCFKCPIQPKHIYFNEVKKETINCYGVIMWFEHFTSQREYSIMVWFPKNIVAKNSKGNMRVEIDFYNAKMMAAKLIISDKYFIDIDDLDHIGVYNNRR